MSAYVGSSKNLKDPKTSRTPAGGAQAERPSTRRRCVLNGQYIVNLVYGRHDLSRVVSAQPDLIVASIYDKYSAVSTALTMLTEDLILSQSALQGYFAHKKNFPPLGPP